MSEEDLSASGLAAETMCFACGKDDGVVIADCEARFMLE